MKSNAASRKRTACLFLIAAVSSLCFAADEPPASPQRATGSGLYLKVQLAGPVKLSKLKPGDVVEGSLARDVYSSDQQLFTAGSRVHLTVDSLQKRRRAKNDHWPWVVNAFTPRHENYPVFKAATVSGPNGEIPLQVSPISVNQMREVHAQTRKLHGKNNAAAPPAGAVETTKATSASGSEKSKSPIMVLEASSPDQSSTTASTGYSPSDPDLSGTETLPAGTACKVLLLGDVSASQSKPGDVILARLLDPVLLNSRIVLPAGSVIEGKVVKKTPPRWGSRAGSLSLTFTELTRPGGSAMPIAASLSGAQLDQKSHTKIDAEGKLQGEHPGKAWMAINIGMSVGLGKVSDDTLQLIIEAIVSTATDVSTAGAGRIAAACVSGIFMVSRHGRDVVLPRFTEMEISLDRPLLLSQHAEATATATTDHGN